MKMHFWSVTLSNGEKHVVQAEDEKSAVRRGLRRGPKGVTVIRAEKVDAKSL